MSKTTLLRAAVAAGLALAIAAPSLAKTTYHWVTDDGVASYSDSLKRVPERYRSRVSKVTLKDLRNYPRWTPSDTRAEGSYAERLPANLERLRSVNDERARHGHARRMGMHGRRHPGDRIVVRAGRSDRGGPEVQAGFDRGAGIVSVEDVRVKTDRGSSRHVRVVRQGDRVIALIKGEQTRKRIFEGRDEDLVEQIEDGLLD